MKAHTIIKRPHITEKATHLSEKGIYVFEVSPKTNKREVVKAVQALYNITPVKVRMITVPAKKVFVRGRVGFTAKMKKAMVFLKKGDVIEAL
ncbi:MAG: 50S ribosomal protein L23 [Candidatus Lloydbacteria bacterium]|nr:50S ribosomal protein L23 [Candidatus Lloydbacteria bacterium]